MGLEGRWVVREARGFPGVDGSVNVSCQVVQGSGYPNGWRRLPEAGFSFATALGRLAARREGVNVDGKRKRGRERDMERVEMMDDDGPDRVHQQVEKGKSIPWSM